MRRTLILAAGLCAGLTLAGVANAVLIPWLPPQVRGERLVWSVTIVIVIIATTATGALILRRRR
jgi:hypothetical protein